MKVLMVGGHIRSRFCFPDQLSKPALGEPRAVKLRIPNGRYAAQSCDMNPSALLLLGGLRIELGGRAVEEKPFPLVGGTGFGEAGMGFPKTESRRRRPARRTGDLEATSAWRPSP